MSLLPPNQPFYKHALDEFSLQKLFPADDPQSASAVSQIKLALSRIELAVLQEAEILNLRNSAYQVFRELIVGGNALLALPKDKNFRAFRLDQYCVNRDPSGALVQLVIKECIDPVTLEDSIKEQILVNGKIQTVKTPGGDEVVELYTAVVRKDKDTYRHWQEIGGVVLDGTTGEYETAELPYLALRFSKLDGESYGQSYVADYEGDLFSLESMSQSLVEAAEVSAFVLFLNRPASGTRLKDLREAKNGDFVTGDIDDVGVLQLGKYADFKFVQEEVSRIEGRLSMAFLLHSSVQRQAERVTAEEIRYMAQELETALGGIFSLLAAEFQLPIVTLLLDRMQEQQRMPELPEDLVHPTVVTGLDAIGRGYDLNKLDAFVAGAAQVIGPEAMVQHLNTTEYLTRRATAAGVNPAGLINTPEQVAEQNQQGQLQSVLEKLGPNAITQMGNLAKQNQEGTANAGTN